MEDVPVHAELRHKIRMCFQEAVTNAVVHGNQCDESKYVRIFLVHNDSKITMEVSDEGQGFDLTKISNPLKEEQITKPSGRGLFLIKEFSENFSYSPEEKKLRMEFKIDS